MHASSAGSFAESARLRRARQRVQSCYSRRPNHEHYMQSFFLPASRHALLGIAFALLAGCASSPSAPPFESQIEVAFSPDAGSEALVLKVIGNARSSVRLAGYSFTSPSVVRALTDAKRRGVDVRVLIDDKGNRGKANIAAMNLLVGVNIPTKVISSYAIHHDKYIVVDGKHTQTGSFKLQPGGSEVQF